MAQTDRKRMLWIVPPVVIGVLAMVLLTSNKEAPQKTDKQAVSRVVRTITVPSIDLNPVAEGYGTVTPANVWTAVSQVSGRIIEMHPRLRDGEIISQGALLFRIDPVDYELALAQLQAELAELGVQQQNTKDLLKIEQHNLNLAQREASRLSKLAAKGTASRSSADEAERAMLSSRAAVQNLKNSLALLPSQRKVVQAKLKQAKRDLEHTWVYAPFNLRVAGLAIEKDQYVATGQKLLEGDSVERSEVIAQVALSSLRHLFRGHGDSVPVTEKLAQNFPAFAELQAVIQMDMGGHIAQWDAEFVRFSDNIDNETRTIGAVVALDKPYEKIIPGRRPPLSKGMFVKVRLIGRTQAGQMVIPRTAVRNGKVMLINEAQTLAIREVIPLYNQGDLTVIESGLRVGEQVVVSDLVPAVAGMPLRGQPDAALQQQLVGAEGLVQ